MTAGGGRGSAKGSREALNKGLATAIANRQRRKEEGMAAARAWRDEHHPICPGCGRRI